MKKSASLLLIFLLLGLCACGQKATTEAAPTWQDQYDLGIRYLSEGNYEEAIIAFTAAIEIEPKRPEAYIGLSNAYTGLGDTDAARQALEDGFAATGDESLQALLAELEDDASDTAGDLGWSAYIQGVETFYDGDYAQALELLNTAIAAFESDDMSEEDSWGLSLSAGAAVRVCYAMGDIHATLDYFTIVEERAGGLGGEWGSVNTMTQPETGGKDYALYDEAGAELLHIQIYDRNGKETTIYRYGEQVEVYENGQPVENLYWTDTGIGWTSPGAG